MNFYSVTSQWSNGALQKFILHYIEIKPLKTITIDEKSEARTSV